MIQAHSDTHPTRDQLIAKLMELPNATVLTLLLKSFTHIQQQWSEIMTQASRSIEFLAQPDTTKNIANILKTNVRTCYSLGHFYISQLGRLYLDMLNVYKSYSEMISNTVASSGIQPCYSFIEITDKLHFQVPMQQRQA